MKEEDILKEVQEAVKKPSDHLENAIISFGALIIAVLTKEFISYMIIGDMDNALKVFGMTAGAFALYVVPMIYFKTSKKKAWAELRKMFGLYVSEDAIVKALEKLLNVDIDRDGQVGGGNEGGAVEKEVKKAAGRPPATVIIKREQPVKQQKEAQQEEEIKKVVKELEEKLNGEKKPKKPLKLVAKLPFRFKVSR